MKPSFSELSYAFALTDNLVKAIGFPLLSAPAFPSTVTEANRGAGHDLKLSYEGVALFLQFKLSHCMRYGSAREFKSGKFQQRVSGKVEPVYRMYLMPLGKSRQTSLMLKLEKRHKLVRYVAPLFHLNSDLSRHYFAGEVGRESRFFRPSRIKKMPDQLEHFVSFRAVGKHWRFSNDPIEVEGVETQEEIVSLLTHQEQPISAADAIEEALSAMVGAIGEDREESQRSAPNSELDGFDTMDLSPLSRAEFIARTYFDAHLFVVNTSESPPVVDVGASNTLYR